MKLATIGLGRIGMAVTQRLLQGGHEVIAYDINPEVLREAATFGAEVAGSLEDTILRLDTRPRIVWLSIPAGETVGLTLQQLAMLLGEDDIILEASNSYYRDSQERAKMLRFKGIYMLDVGVSGGIWGLEYGFNLMVGGDADAFAAVEPILATLAPENGYGLVGPSGAGHFAKMVHNGIEYGMSQAIAEGFELIAARQEFEIDLAALARLWENGSTIRSWLLELTASAMEEDPGLDWVEPRVEDTGEGRWTVTEGLEMEVPLPVITLALQMRFHSRQESSFAMRLLAALHNQAGGRDVR